MSQPPIQPLLPPNTIVPINEDLFIPYLNRLYEDIASAVNSKDPKYYPMAISSSAQNILNVPSFGAYVICVSGVDETLPTVTASLCKSSKTVAGSVTGIGAQVGTGTFWGGFQLIISSTATNFQIRHDKVTVPITVGNFNIRLIGTQG